MSNDPSEPAIAEPVRVTLDLGELELSLEELLALREGSSFSVETPQVLTGKLRVQGLAYALVAITPEAGKLALEVRQLIDLPSEKK